MHGHNLSRQDVLNVVRVGDLTLRNRLAEFENTPTSLLTAEEFETKEMVRTRRCAGVCVHCACACIMHVPRAGWHPYLSVL